MYLSKKYKLLVLRTPKTGSSSLSEFLIKKIDDPDAIYTEIDDSGIPGTLNEHIVNRNRPFKYFHFTLNDLIREGVITPDIIMNYRCISVLRNPVDRQKSFYYFMKKQRDIRFIIYHLSMNSLTLILLKKLLIHTF